MNQRTTTTEPPSHASRPFFATGVARATPFFSPSPPIVAAQAEVDEENQASVDVGPELVVQAKLTMAAPDDPHEREADVMAELAVQQMSTGEPSGARATSAPRPDDESGDWLQGKAAGAMDVPDAVARSLQGGAGGGHAIQSSLREEMESVFQTDFSTVRVHVGADAERLNDDLHARAFTHGRDIYFNSGEYHPESSQGRLLLAHELTHVVQQGMAQTSTGQLHRQPKPKDDTTFVPYQIHVGNELNSEQFKALAMQQIFGAQIPNLRWSRIRTLYDPKDSPFTLNVSATLLRNLRSDAQGRRGFSVDSDGLITGAKDRARTFGTSLPSDGRTALMNEINRRFSEAIGDMTNTKIRQGEVGKATLWNIIRDEVLFQSDYIANLPPAVKELIRVSTDGKVLTLADYDKLFSIAKKIERLPPGQVSDYASKVRESTTDLNVFDASLEKYLAEMAEREKQRVAREETTTKLAGLEEIYKKYRLYKSLATSSAISGAVGMSGAGMAGGGGLVTANESIKLLNELNTDLKRFNFSGVDDFEAYIKKFTAQFELESAAIAKDLLAKYAGKLYRESERYRDPVEVDKQFQSLSGYRQSFAEFETNAAISNDYKTKSEAGRVPGQWQIRPDVTQEEAKVAYDKAVVAKTDAQNQFKSFSARNPVFNEEGMADDRKIDKVALAKADSSGFAAMISQQIKKRLKEIDDARDSIDAKSELIYKMDKLLPMFYVQQSIKPDSIFDMIIQDKMREDAIVRIATGIALAVVAIALSVISFGTATPAIIAAGAGIAGAALGTYSAYEAIQEYSEEKDLAAVGFASDPSLVWVVLAIVGAGLDIAAAVKALKVLGPAAKLYNASGDIAEFTKTVRALERAGELEAKIARAAERAAQSRKGLSESFTEFLKVVSGKAYSFPGPLADPDVYKALVKLAWNAVKTGGYDVIKFLEEIKLKYSQAKLAALTPEELGKVKQAWADAKALEVAEQANVGKYTTKIEWGIHKALEARPHPTIEGAFWGKRIRQSNPRVDAYELKINPNNESLYLPMGDGTFAQLENIVGDTIVQDGKLVMAARSQYHVADLPSFAKDSVLKEARRQVTAASRIGARVEWLVSEARAESQLRQLFTDKGVAVTVRLLPE